MARSPRSTPPPLPPVRLVLVKPTDPRNLGAIARVMKNMGLADWAVVQLGTHDLATARRVAVHAGDLLERPRLARTLDEAVADCCWVVGTSPRRVRGRRSLGPAEVAREALSRAPGRTAIVFGEERSGLTNAEALRCHDLSAIPAAPEQPSLNLAQAVLVYAWELRRAALLGCSTGSNHSPAPSPRPSPPVGEREDWEPPGPGSAPDADLASIEELLRSVLRASGFLQGPERHAVRDLAQALRRARLSRSEARLWAAALRTLGRRGPRGSTPG